MAGYVALGAALGSMLFKGGDDSGRSSSSSSSNPWIGYMFQDYWRAQDRQVFNAGLAADKVENARRYYDDLYNYRQQFVLRYGASRPDELSIIDENIHVARANLVNQENHFYGTRVNSRNYWALRTKTASDPGGWVDEIGYTDSPHDRRGLPGYEPDNWWAMPLPEATGTGIMGEYAAINEKLAGIESDFANSLGQHAQARAASDTAFEQRMVDNLTQMTGSLRGANAEFKNRMQKSLNELSGKVSENVARQKSALTTLKEQLAGSTARYAAATDEARTALTGQEEFYASLIDDPGLASGQVRNLLTQSERDLTGQIQSVQDYYTRIGRSGSGEERKAVAALRTTLAQSFAENVAFTSDYGRQQSVAVALEKAGLSKDEAAFAAQNAQSLFAGEGATSEMLQNLATSLFGAETATADAIKGSETETAKGIFGAQGEVAGQIHGSQIATAESNLAGSQFASQLATQLAGLGIDITGKKAQLEASLVAPSIASPIKQYDPIAYGQPEPSRTSYEVGGEQPMDLQGLGQLLSIFASSGG